MGSSTGLSSDGPSSSTSPPLSSIEPVSSTGLSSEVPSSSPSLSLSAIEPVSSTGLSSEASPSSGSSSQTSIELLSSTGSEASETSPDTGTSVSLFTPSPMHTSSSPYSVKKSSISSSGASVSTPQSSDTQGISVSSLSNMETTSIVTSTINILSLQDETNNKIEDLNTLLQEVGSDSSIGEELTSSLSLLQTLSNGLGSIAGAETRNQGRRKRESDCSALKMVAAATDAIIPVLETMKAESRNVNSYISTTKRDIAQIKSALPSLREHQC